MVTMLKYKAGSYTINYIAGKYKTSKSYDGFNEINFKVFTLHHYAV